MRHAAVVMVTAAAVQPYRRCAVAASAPGHYIHVTAFTQAALTAGALKRSHDDSVRCEGATVYVLPIAEREQ